MKITGCICSVLAAHVFTVVTARADVVRYRITTDEPRTFEVTIDHGVTDQFDAPGFGLYPQPAETYPFPLEFAPDGGGIPSWSYQVLDDPFGDFIVLDFTYQHTVFPGGSGTPGTYLVGWNFSFGYAADFLSSDAAAILEFPPATFAAGFYSNLDSTVPVNVTSVTIVPGPGTGVLLAIGAAVAMRRRR